MPAPRVVLLDLDGTLVDASDAIVDGVLALAAETGLTVPEPDWARSRIGQPPDETWALLGADDPGAVSQAFIDRFVPGLPARTRVLPGVVEALDALREFGATLALVTTRTTSSARETLAALKLDRWVSEIIGRDLVAAAKPAPDAIHHALERLAADAGSALMIGDSDVDVLAARAAGVRCWAVLGGVGNEAGLCAAGADLILPHGLADLPATWRATNWS
jgi:phosphoglycolate phosphatase